MPIRSSESNKSDSNNQEPRAQLGATGARHAAAVQAAYILESRTR
jgi:hypothetical protein